MARYFADMSIFKSWFGKKKEADAAHGLSMQFGRFSDAYKSVDQYHAWDSAVSFYENGDYQESLDKFLYYLYNHIYVN